MLKYILLFIGLSCSAAEVYILNSIDNHFSLRYGNFNSYVENVYTEYLEDTGFHLNFIHDAKLADFHKLQIEGVKNIFWIGHGTDKYIDAVNEGLITDNDGVNVASVFKEANHEFDFFAVITCNSKEIIRRDDIVTYSGKVKPLKAMKSSLLTFHKRFGISRTCRSKVTMPSKRRKTICKNSRIDRTQSEVQDLRVYAEASDEMIITIKIPKRSSHPSHLQVFLNGKFLEVIESHRSEQKIRIPKSLLKSASGNELVLSSGETGRKTLAYNFNDFEVLSPGSEFEVFSINGESTLDGKIMFAF